MAYTADRTWVVGEVVTANLMNTYLRDNVKWLSTDKPMVRCNNTAAITCATGVVTQLTFNNNRFDNAGIHSTATNTNRITVSVANAGKYLVGAAINWAASTLGDFRVLGLRIGTGPTNIALATQTPGGTNGFANQTASGLYSLSGDYFESVAQQNSGGNLDVTLAANSSPEFWAIWLGI